MSEVTEVEKKDISQKCHDFLHNWNTLALQDVEISRIITGVANKTFRVSMKNTKLLNKNVKYKDVIIHIYNCGLFKGESKLKLNGESAEVMVMQILSESGLAPKLLGVFAGGRIEEYIPSSVASVDELKSVELSKAVIRKVAHYHTQTMPISKQPNFIEKLIDVVNNTNITGQVPDLYAHERENCLKIINFPIVQELEWFKKIVPIIGNRIVFSHNDLNPNNILLKENVINIDEKVILIDYEMSMYFYRGYDLAYFLRMKHARLQNINNKITFTLDEEDSSANEAILEEYLNEWRKLNESSFDSKIDNLDTLRKEASFFSLVPYLSSITLIQHVMYEAVIPFPLDLCAQMASGYQQRKKSVIDKYGDPITWKNSTQ